MAKKILVVEDDESTTNLLELWLTNMGHEVICSSDGYEGLKAAQRETPDLIILDVGLPKMNGFKVCRLLKYDNKYKHIPIIMLTAQELEDSKQLGRDSGADEYVFKSSCKHTLPALIKKHLKPAS
ncbi:response regulator [bacterium]|nr:response regulator [bacterium]